MDKPQKSRPQIDFERRMVVAAIDSAVNAIIIIDDHGIVQRINPATEKMFGFAAAELVGQNVRMLMPAYYRDAHDGYIHNYLTTGRKKIIGIGRPRPIEPFFTAKGAGNGTGLGLSVIYGFAKQSGGHVAIYSEPGHGTIVNLYLPRTTTEDEMRIGETRKERLRVPTGETVLVVKDQTPVREVTIRRLQQLGYMVKEAEDAVRAIDMLESGEKVDVIFSDIVMPSGMSGFDLAAWVHVHRPHIPVVLTSGFAENAAQNLAKDANPRLRSCASPIAAMSWPWRSAGRWTAGPNRASPPA